jgi:hypothetical protein
LLIGARVRPSVSLRDHVAFAFILALTGCGSRSGIFMDQAAITDASSTEPPTADASIGVPPIRDAGLADACTPADCGRSAHWDKSSCTCVGNPCGDESGSSVTIASTAPDEGDALAVQSGNVYWTTWSGADGGRGTLHKVSRCGGTVTTLATSEFQLFALAADAKNVYWGSAGVYARRGNVMRVPVNGGSPVSIWASGGVLGALTIDSNDVYWGAYGGAGGLWKAPIAGGPAVALIPDQLFNFVAVDATHVFAAQPATVPDNSVIVSVPLAGGEPSVLVRSIGYAMMVADDTSLYYQALPSAIMQIDKAGGPPTTLAVSQFAALAVDATYVYWVTLGYPTSALMRVSKEGGAPSTLATFATGGSQAVPAIALDDAYIYWLHGSDVMRIGR